MKKYMIGFLFFICVTSGSLIGLFWLTANPVDEANQEVQAIETVEQPVFTEEEKKDAETVHLVLNQESVKAEIHEKRYCLCVEEGYLIVYDRENQIVDLVTYMPVVEFPTVEQERLMEGIWFATMNELFSYLESYSS